MTPYIYNNVYASLSVGYFYFVESHRLAPFRCSGLRDDDLGLDSRLQARSADAHPDAAAVGWGGYDGLAFHRSALHDLYR